MQLTKSTRLWLCTLALPLCGPLFVSGQSLDFYQISTLKDSVTAEPFDAERYRQQILEKYKDVITNSKRLNNYADLLTEDALYTYNTHYIYRDWSDAEAFLLNVLRKAAPENVIDPSVKIHVVRDAEVNAWCREDGTIFVNVGFLATVQTEAELAAVLCHELGHYLNFHSYKRYEKEVSTRNTAITLSRLFNVGGGIALASGRWYEQEQEAEADDFIVKAFQQNSYRNEDAAAIFDRFLKIEELSKKGKHYRLPLFYISTHPPTPNRIAKMQTIQKPGNTSSFLVDEGYFSELRRRAINECIYLLFTQGNYDACLYYAFREHLEQSESQFYLFYLVESLRRLCLLNDFRGGECFLTDNYALKEVKPEKSAQVKSTHPKKAGYSIFFHWQELYPGINHLDPSKALFRNDTLEFVTNREALTYFTQLCLNKCPGCFLSLRMMDLPYSPSTGSGELSRHYWSLTQAVNHYTTTLNSYEDIPVIFNNVYASESSQSYNKLPFVSTWQIRADYAAYARNRGGKPFVFNHVILPSDLVNLTASMDLLEDYYYRKTGIRSNKTSIKNYKERKYETLPLDAVRIFPELALLSQKYKFRKIVFFDMSTYTQTSQVFNETSQTQSNICTVYCIDLLRKTIGCAKSKFSSGSPSSVGPIIADLEFILGEFSRE